MTVPAGRRRSGWRLRAGRPLHAVVGPRPALRLERRVPRRVPVLRREHERPPRGESRRDGRQRPCDLRAGGHGQRAAGTKVVLHIDDNQGVGLGQLHRGHLGARLPDWLKRTIPGADSHRHTRESGYPPGVGVFFSPSLNRATTRRHAKILVGVASCSSRSTRARATITCSSMGAMATAIGRSSLDARRTATSALAPTGSSWRPAPVAPPSGCEYSTPTAPRARCAATASAASRSSPSSAESSPAAMVRSISRRKPACYPSPRTGRTAG